MPRNLLNYGVAIGISLAAGGAGVFARRQYFSNRWPFVERSSAIITRDAANFFGVIVATLVAGISVPVATKYLM